MDSQALRSALNDLTNEADPTIKHLKLASLVSTLFRERGVELVVVGGSAIEFYTEGAYVSGDVDLCIASASVVITVRQRQEIMAQLGAEGGPRSWQVAGAFVDVLASFENLARTPIRSLNAPYGEVRVSPPEELIVERILVSKYPQEYAPARECANKLLASFLSGEVEVDWNEIQRLAESPAYKNWKEVKGLIDENAKALKVRGPYDPDE